MAQVTQVNPEALNVASQMILREIDLTGTDAERKAKLDQFEKDWKALTGASDLSGARFVGYVETEDYSRCSCIFCYEEHKYFEGLSFTNDNNGMVYSAWINLSDGFLTITPLFQHLEAITIYTDNTDAHMKQNLDNIAAYEANLQALGVDINGCFIPARTDVSDFGYLSKSEVDGVYGGSFYVQGSISPIVDVRIDMTNGEYSAYQRTVDMESWDYYKSLNAKSLEAITIKTSNSPDDKAANKAAIEGYVNNLKSLGVDTSKGYLIPVNINPQVSSGGEGLGYMVIKPQETIYRGQYWYDLDRLVSFYVSAENGAYTRRYVDFGSPTSNLTTTSKQIVGAINEVNGKIGQIDTILAQITGDPADAVTTLEAEIPVEGFELNETEE